MRHILVRGLLAAAALLPLAATAGQIYSSAQTQPAMSASTGLYADEVRVPARSRTAPAITMERIADFEARVLCYRIQGSADVSCVPFTQVNAQFINDLAQRATEAQR